MLRMSPDTGRLSPWGPLPIQGEPGMWGEGARGGTSLCEGFHKEDLDGGLL